jgi:hypothetical protein
MKIIRKAVFDIAELTAVTSTAEMAVARERSCEFEDSFDYTGPLARGIEGWIGAVAVVAAGTIGGAVISSGASKSAVNAQEQAAQNANSTQLAELQANAGLQTPGRNLGYGADALLAQLYGLPNPNSGSTTAGYGANQSLNAIGGIPGVLGGAGGVTGTGGTGATSNIGPTGTNGTGAAGGQPYGASSQYANFYNSPGYQFALGQGQQAINRGAAANGNLYTPNTLNQLDQNAQGFASSQYNNYVQQLMGLAGIGGQATASTVSSATTAGNNISANQLSAGNANASGILGSAGAFSGAINNVGGQLGNYAALTSNPPINYNSYAYGNGP